MQEWLKHCWILVMYVMNISSLLQRFSVLFEVWQEAWGGKKLMQCKAFVVDSLKVKISGSASFHNNCRQPI